MKPELIQNKFLLTHLRYVEKTESPKLMHVWSAVAAASACLGRHVYLPFGIGKIYPNLYILLVGPPGTRKSAAIGFASDLVEEHTEVRFAPDDTNGQRQGLIAAIEGLQDADEDEDFLRAESAAGLIANMENLEIEINGEDAHTMFVCADEFQSFIGQNSLEMTTFLIKMYDGKKKYDYKLKKEKNVLTNPLLSMIGGTTPTSIATIIPPAAVGQGFMSRIIMVHWPEKEASVPRPELDDTARIELINTFKYLTNTAKGAITESEDAAALLNKLYEKPVKIADNRFIYYAERRHTHLLKTCLVLAATRRSATIDVEDVLQADSLLTETEKTMPDALGQFGLSPLAQAKQKMVEYIQFAKCPVPITVLWAVMNRDMKRIDFQNCMADLINAKKVAQVDTTAGASLIYMDEVEEGVQALLDQAREEQDDKLNDVVDEPNERMRG